MSEKRANVLEFNFATIKGLIASLFYVLYFIAMRPKAKLSFGWIMNPIQPKYKHSFTEDSLKFLSGNWVCCQTEPTEQRWIKEGKAACHLHKKNRCS
jgi:hypothetical protein